jgi:hypothetical protein
LALQNRKWRHWPTTTLGESQPQSTASDWGHHTGNDAAAWRTIPGQSKCRDTVGPRLERGLPPDMLRTRSRSQTRRGCDTDKPWTWLRSRIEHGSGLDTD